MVSCADCLEQTRMRRVGSEVRFHGDCSVATFREITGCDNDFASEVLLAAGFTPGAGTRQNDLRNAFESDGVQGYRRNLSRPGRLRRSRA